MLALSGASHTLWLNVISGSGTIGRSYSYVDINSTTGAFVGAYGSLAATITSPNEVAISTAPGAGITRNIKHVTVFNTSPTDSAVIEIYTFLSAVQAIEWRGTLLPNERVRLSENGDWILEAADGTKK